MKSTPEAGEQEIEKAHTFIISDDFFSVSYPQDGFSTNCTMGCWHNEEHFLLRTF